MKYLEIPRPEEILRLGVPRLGRLLLLAGFLVIAAACTGAPQPHGWSGPAVAGQTIWTGTNESQMVAVDPSSQAVTLRYPPSGAEGPDYTLNGIYATPVITDGAVYFGAYNGTLYALDEQTGQERWKFAAGDSIIGGVLPYQGLLYFGTSAGVFRALDPATRQVRCEFAAPKSIWSTPVEAGGTIFVTSLDQRLYAFDPATCQPRSNFAENGSFAADAAIAATPTVVDGTIYVGAMNNSLYAIDATTGAQRWVFTGADNWFWNRPAVHRGLVLAGSLDYNFYALDAQTGAERWRFPSGQQIHADPVVAGDLVIFGSYDGKVYGLNIESGTKVWEYAAGAPVLAPLTISDGTVFVNTWQDDRLHALDATSGAPRWVVSLKR